MPCAEHGEDERDDEHGERAEDDMRGAMAESVQCASPRAAQASDALHAAIPFGMVGRDGANGSRMACAYRPRGIVRSARAGDVAGPRRSPCDAGRGGGEAARLFGRAVNRRCGRGGGGGSAG